MNILLPSVKIDYLFIYKEFQILLIFSEFIDALLFAKISNRPHCLSLSTNFVDFLTSIKLVFVVEEDQAFSFLADLYKGAIPACLHDLVIAQVLYNIIIKFIYDLTK